MDMPNRLRTATHLSRDRIMGREPLSRRLIRGAVAGAAGTFALNATTYADMLATGRPASSAPTDMVKTVAGHATVPLSTSDDEDEAGGKADNRAEAGGALLGLATGVAGGLAYGALRPHVKGVPTLLAGLAAGLAVMAATDSSMAASGVTKPSQWGVGGWLSDLVPHAAFGVALAWVFDRD